LSERTPRWPWRSTYGPLLQQDRPDRLWWVLADAHRRNLRCQVGSISFDGQTFRSPILKVAIVSWNSDCKVRATTIGRGSSISFVSRQRQRRAARRRQYDQVDQGTRSQGSVRSDRKQKRRSDRRFSPTRTESDRSEVYCYGHRGLAHRVIAVSRRPRYAAGGGGGGLGGLGGGGFGGFGGSIGNPFFGCGRPGGVVRPYHPTPTGRSSGSQRPSLCGRPRRPLKNCLVAAQADVMLRGTLVGLWSQYQ
jgi:hypothetical protein